jgi:hypothetical protein
MTHHGAHLSHESLSALLDEQLTADEAERAGAHLAGCAECNASLDELQALVGLLRGLPEVVPPRDLALGPRLLGDPPNLIRLRRWYTVARTSAASLAAVFVLLSVGALYVDSQPARPANLASQPQVAASAPTAVTNAAPPTQAPRAVAPAPAAAVRAVAPGQQGTEADQVAAATSIQPLPTPIPTPAPTPRPLPRPVAALVSEPDPAAPLRTAAALVGVCAALTILVTVLIRHRLRAVSA